MFFIQVTQRDQQEIVVIIVKIEEAKIVSYALIIVGLTLLIFTFLAAYSQLAAINFLPTPDLSEALGKILGPIAEALIRVLYLGVMGWVGSILTIRGIQLYKEARHPPQISSPVQHSPQPTTENSKKPT